MLFENDRLLPIVLHWTLLWQRGAYSRILRVRFNATVGGRQCSLYDISFPLVRGGKYYILGARSMYAHDGRQRFIHWLIGVYLYAPVKSTEAILLPIVG